LDGMIQASRAPAKGRPEEYPVSKWDCAYPKSSGSFEPPLPDAAMTIKIKTSKTPTQCELWEKPELVDGPPMDRCERLKCRECGQLYFVEFYEGADWKEGNDRCYVPYIPVAATDQGIQLSAENIFGLTTDFPRPQSGVHKHAGASSFGGGGNGRMVRAPMQEHRDG
jgi:hypothetical protein